MATIVLTDSNTGEDVSYVNVTTWVDGTAMSDTKVDGVIYIKSGTLYYKRIYSGPLDVKWFGAKGDGTTDDTVAINNAVNTALSLGKNLFLPSGTYRVDQAYNSVNGSGATTSSINVDKSGVKKIRIFGEPGATKITTSRTSGSIIYFYYQCKDCSLEHIFFENTHGVVTTQTTGIFVMGLSGNSNKNFKIKNCRFEGFSTAIVAQGIVGFTIENNVFEAPLGHDNAQNNSQPAVFVWFADNTNGQCYDVKVLNNYANGYTGSNITGTTTCRPMDGFIYGACYGILYQGNTTRNFCQEHFCLAPNTVNPGYNYPVTVTGNQFYLSIPTGSAYGVGGTAITSNYGVRADCNNVVITNNDFYDYTLGVLIYPFVYPTIKAHSYKISGNRFYSPRSTTYNVNQAIKVQGYNQNGNQAYNIVISDNFVDIDGIQLKSNTAVFTIYDCELLRVMNNDIFARNVTSGTFTLSAMQYGRSTGIIDESNEVRGISNKYSLDTINSTDITYK